MMDLATKWRMEGYAEYGSLFLRSPVAVQKSQLAAGGASGHPAQRWHRTEQKRRFSPNLADLVKSQDRSPKPCKTRPTPGNRRAEKLWSSTSSAPISEVYVVGPF